MGLPDLWTPGPGLNGWREFWFNNWISHQDIVQAVAKQKSINLQMYPIDPWVQDDANSILAAHQQYHDDMNQALGLPGQDLTGLDLSQENILRTWVWQHVQEHLNAHAVLKI